MSVSGLCAEVTTWGTQTSPHLGLDSPSPPSLVPKPHLSPGRQRLRVTCSICPAYSLGPGREPWGPAMSRSQGIPLRSVPAQGHLIESAPFMPQYMLVR